MNKIFEVLGKYKKYIEFYHTARARPRARAKTMQHGPSASSDIEWRCWDTLGAGVHSAGCSDLADAVCG
jgi:hypothetical protein